MKNDITPAAPGFLQCLAWLAIVGSVLLVVGNIVGSIVVPGHDWVADTVSDLAAGRYEIIQDLALYGYAGALAALALAGAHIHPGARRWSVNVFSLILLAICVVVIAARNEYGDSDNEGVVVHIYVVYLLGLLFAVVFGVSGWRGHGLDLWFVRLSRTSFILWGIAAPTFFLLPTSFDGLWERGLGVICVVWSVSMGLALLHLSRRVKPRRRI